MYCRPLSVSKAEDCTYIRGKAKFHHRLVEGEVPPPGHG